MSLKRHFKEFKDLPGLQSIAFIGEIFGVQMQITWCAQADIPLCWCVPTNLIGLAPILEINSYS